MRKRVISADSLDKLLILLAREERLHKFQYYNVWDLLLFLRKVIKDNAYEVEIGNDEVNNTGDSP